jgi:hypothetical protein
MQRTFTAARVGVVGINVRLLGGVLAAVIATSGSACKLLRQRHRPAELVPGLEEAQLTRSLKTKHPGRNRPDGTLSRLQATPSLLAFGDVGAGSEGRQAVVISNPSDFSVTIVSATIEGAGFAILSPVEDRSVIPAHEQLTFTVTFRPVVQGACSGELLLQIDSAVGRYTQVLLTGRGV